MDVAAQYHNLASIWKGLICSVRCSEWLPHLCHVDVRENWPGPLSPMCLHVAVKPITDCRFMQRKCRIHHVISGTTLSKTVPTESDHSRSCCVCTLSPCKDIPSDLLRGTVFVLQQK